MIGYRVTEKGAQLLEAFLAELWIPGMDDRRLQDMALTLTKMTFNSADEYFSLNSFLADEVTLLNLKALERERYIERTPVPEINRMYRNEEFQKKHPKPRPWQDDEEDLT